MTAGERIEEASDFKTERGASYERRKRAMSMDRGREAGVRSKGDKRVRESVARQWKRV